MPRGIKKSTYRVGKGEYKVDRDLADKWAVAKRCKGTRHCYASKNGENLKYKGHHVYVGPRGGHYIRVNNRNTYVRLPSNNVTSRSEYMRNNEAPVKTGHAEITKNVKAYATVVTDHSKYDDDMPDPNDMFKVDPPRIKKSLTLKAPNRGSMVKEKKAITHEPGTVKRSVKLTAKPYYRYNHVQKHVNSEHTGIEDLSTVEKGIYKWNKNILVELSVKQLNREFSKVKGKNKQLLVHKISHRLARQRNQLPSDFLTRIVEENIRS